LEVEVAVWAKLVVIEEQGLGGDGQGQGELADDFQRGLGGTGLVESNLGQGRVDQIDQGVLGQVLLFGQGGRVMTF
jgi:hypothetical protein